MTDKYCPRGEIKKLKVELWNLKDFPEESDKIERYISGLPDMIHGSVMASKPKTMQDVIELTTELMDKKISTFAERQAENKRNVLRNATSEIGLAIWLVIVGVLQMPMPLTTKGVLGLVRKSLALSVEPKDISRGSVQILRTTIMNMSFDVIIGMNWLAKYQAVIVCAEKIVRILWGNETLIIRGDGSDWGNETRLNINSYTKMQKYMLKGCHVFLAHVTTKESEDNSEKKRLEEVPIVRDSP
nr:reverse transcriptase domain-containing protein [Tanacetum cinerariifolium]